MRVVRTALVILFVLTSSLNLSSQEAISPRRDAQALMTLGQMVNAAGWLPASLPIAITSSGTLTHFDGDQQGTESLILKQRGPSQRRIDIVSSSATTSTVVNGLAGIILFSDGTKYHLRPHAALSNGSPVFPFFSDLISTSDLSVDIQDLGSDTIDGSPCHGVSVARRAAKDDKVGEFRDLAAPLKVWISMKSDLPVRIDFIRLADDNPYLPLNFSRSFSDYRFVNGVAVAFTQEERFEGQLMYRLQFTDVQFNSSLSDADFDASKL
jgi:hypothetical protein